MKTFILVFNLLMFLLLSGPTRAAQDDGSLKDLGEKPLPAEVTQSSKQREDSENGPDKVESVSAFGQIQPFNEVIVLQRKYLPKQKRLEFGLGYGLLTDNPFFKTNVYMTRLSYSFTEMYGIEATYWGTTVSDSKVTTSLFENGGVVSSIKSVPSQYYGAAFRWTPIYGKVALFNHFILPIENYYLLGGGQTKLKDQTGNAGTFHIGGGLSFGLKKWLALRTELSFYGYSAPQGGGFFDTHFNVGFSTFFPGATYR